MSIDYLFLYANNISSRCRIQLHAHTYVVHNYDEYLQILTALKTNDVNVKHGSSEGDILSLITSIKLTLHYVTAVRERDNTVNKQIYYTSREFPIQNFQRRTTDILDYNPQYVQVHRKTKDLKD